MEREPAAVKTPQFFLLALLCQCFVLSKDNNRVIHLQSPPDLPLVALAGKTFPVVPCALNCNLEAINPSHNLPPNEILAGLARTSTHFPTLNSYPTSSALSPPKHHFLSWLAQLRSGWKCDNRKQNDGAQMLTLPSQVTQSSQQHLVELLNTAAQQTCNPG